MRLAVLQSGTAAEGPARRIAMIAEAARTATAEGAELMLCPELVTTGYGAGGAIPDQAEPADGPQLSMLGGISAATGLALIAGFAERDGDTVYNSAAFINGQETPVVYRKSHLYGRYEKQLFTAAPPGTVILRHRGLRIGMLICFDVEFPENVRRLARAGVDLICVPTALPDQPGSAFVAERMVPVRAFENQVFLAYADHAGAEGGFAYPGLSCIVAPDGTDLARAGRGPALLIADIDPVAYERSRAENPYIAELGPLAG